MSNAIFEKLLSFDCIALEIEQLSREQCSLKNDRPQSTFCFSPRHLFYPLHYPQIYQDAILSSDCGKLTSIL